MVALDRAALKLQPGNPQFSFWSGVALANAGRDEEALRWFSLSFAAGDAWRELGRRLREVGLYSGDPELLER